MGSTNWQLLQISNQKSNKIFRFLIMIKKTSDYIIQKKKKNDRKMMLFFTLIEKFISESNKKNDITFNVTIFANKIL